MFNENEEDERIVIDISKLFPEAAKRVEILKDLKKYWYSIVGSVAFNSYPYDLGVKEIKIAAKNKIAVGMLNKVQGNIKEKLKKRYNYKIEDDFEIKISEGEQKNYLRR